MSPIEQLLYTAKTHTTAGREGGTSRSDDRRLEVKLSNPSVPGGGTNPEQLLAAGWSACFLSALGLAAKQKGVSLPADRSIDAEIDLGMSFGEFLLRTRFYIRLPGLHRDLAQDLVDTADQLCPYSRATRGNIEVAIILL